MSKPDDRYYEEQAARYREISRLSREAAQHYRSAARWYIAAAIVLGLSAAAQIWLIVEVLC